jgi:predicted nuclease of predicted toxin-antitoxin system
MDPGISDSVVLDLANREGCFLLTADRDFGELVYRQHRLTHGVMLIRLAGIRSDNKAEMVASVVAAHAGELDRAFTVVSPGHVRIRRSGA